VSPLTIERRSFGSGDGPPCAWHFTAALVKAHRDRHCSALAPDQESMAASWSKGRSIAMTVPWTRGSLADRNPTSGGSSRLASSAFEP